MLNDPTADRYLHGECHVLALALHRITGRPILAALAYDPDIKKQALVHCWVSVYGDNVLDAEGLTTTAWSLQRYPDGDCAEVVSLSVVALLKLAEGCATSNADLERRIEEAAVFAKSLLQDEDVAEAMALSAGAGKAPRRRPAGP